MEPQPRPAAGPVPERLRHGGGGFSWRLLLALFVFLTLNSTMAVYQSKGDAAIVGFVATSYFSVVLLTCCICLYNRAAPGSPQTNQLKAFVWLFTMVLAFCFAYEVMGKGGLSLPVALLVWVTAAAPGIGAFSAMFEQGRVNQPPDEEVLALV